MGPGHMPMRSACAAPPPATGAHRRLSDRRARDTRWGTGEPRARIRTVMCALVLTLAGCAPARPVAEPQVQAVAYRIAPGDTLDIVVWGEDKVSGPVQVRPDGMVSVALVGDLQAAGKTPEELADHTGQALARYIDNPNVVVRVAAAGRRAFLG